MEADMGFKDGLTKGAMSPPVSHVDDSAQVHLPNRHYILIYFWCCHLSEWKYTRAWAKMWMKHGRRRQQRRLQSSNR